MPSTTAAPPELAFTGTNLALATLAAVGLLGVGVALRVTSRRMRKAGH